MRIGVIRGDMPGPIAIMDLGTVSQYNPPTEPRGQERRFGRPDAANVGAALGQIPAGIAGSTNVSGGVTINGGNQTLRAKVASAASFTVVTVAPAAYASGAALVAAVSAALATAGLAATARLSNSGQNVVLQSNAKGPGSFVAIDTTGAGSTFNGAVGFAGGGSSFTLPSAAAVITATLPPGGPLNVSAATILSTLGAGGTSIQLDALTDTIAPRFVETDAAIKSFQVGMISGYRSSSYNPDPSRIPALTPGAAISVVQDDGTTPFAVPLTVISAAASNSPNGGDITVTGTNLGNSEVQGTIVRVYSADGARSVQIHQKRIETTLSGGTQGVVSATSIVIPASLLSSLGIAGSKVRVQYTSFASNLFTVA